VGVTDFVRGAIMLFSTRAAAEIAFIGHLTQAHSGTLIGLGCLAWGLRRIAGDLRAVYVPILLGNVLSAYVELTSAPVGGPNATSLIAISQIAWAVCFLWLCFVDAGYAQPLAHSRSEPQMHSPSMLDRLTAFSFSLLVTLSGLIWVFAPHKLATAAAGSLAGPASFFAGQSRGTADVALGLIGLLAGTRRESTVLRCLAVSLVVANVVLTVVGLLAQLSPLYTPARWVVDGLHALWALGFASLAARLMPRPDLHSRTG
jgi:hypothetical protein